MIYLLGSLADEHVWGNLCDILVLYIADLYSRILSDVPCMPRRKRKPPVIVSVLRVSSFQSLILPAWTFTQCLGAWCWYFLSHSLQGCEHHIISFPVTYLTLVLYREPDMSALGRGAPCVSVTPLLMQSLTTGSERCISVCFPLSSVGDSHRLHVCCGLAVPYLSIVFELL